MVTSDWSLPRVILEYWKRIVRTGGVYWRWARAKSGLASGSHAVPSPTVGLPLLLLPPNARRTCPRNPLYVRCWPGCCHWWQWWYWLLAWISSLWDRVSSNSTSSTRGEGVGSRGETSDINSREILPPKTDQLTWNSSLDFSFSLLGIICFGWKSMNVIQIQFCWSWSFPAKISPLNLAKDFAVDINIMTVGFPSHVTAIIIPQHKRRKALSQIVLDNKTQCSNSELFLPYWVEAFPSWITDFNPDLSCSTDLRIFQLCIPSGFTCFPIRFLPRVPPFHSWGQSLAKSTSRAFFSRFICWVPLFWLQTLSFTTFGKLVAVKILIDCHDYGKAINISRVKWIWREYYKKLGRAESFWILSVLPVQLLSNDAQSSEHYPTFFCPLLASSP